MRIGELAGLTGLNPATVRYYERRGLLSRPARTTAGYRSYPAETVVQLRLIRYAKDVGFALREIRELLHPRACGLLQCPGTRQGEPCRAGSSCTTPTGAGGRPSTS